MYQPLWTHCFYFFSCEIHELPAFDCPPITLKFFLRFYCFKWTVNSLLSSTCQIVLGLNKQFFPYLLHIWEFRFKLFLLCCFPLVWFFCPFLYIKWSQWGGFFPLVLSIFFGLSWICSTPTPSIISLDRFFNLLRLVVWIDGKKRGQT